MAIRGDFSILGASVPATNGFRDGMAAQSVLVGHRRFQQVPSIDAAKPYALSLRNVKRWEGDRIERWASLGLIVGEQRFRRVIGCVRGGSGKPPHRTDEEIARKLQRLPVQPCKPGYHCGELP